jgi:hypothetical protein
MKHKYVVIFMVVSVVLCAAAAMAEDPYQVAWAAQIGTSGDDRSRCVAVDAVGNAYVSGRTFGNIGGPNAGSEDAFLRKFDASGNVLWSQQIGTASDEYGWGVAVDAAGNAYMCGTTGGSLGGPSAGGMDTWLTKFDSSGNELWRQQIGTAVIDATWSVAVDASGNAYVSGSTKGDLGGTNQGGNDAYLTKFDTSGNELWGRLIGTSSNDESYSVAVDAAGNVYFSGITGGSLGGPSAGGSDAYLAKFDSSGNELWRQQVGTASEDYGLAVAVDASGNAYISGQTYGSLGGPNAGGRDAFLTKFDASGNELWSQQIGTASLETGYSVAVDNSGNPFICGDTYGSLGGPNAGGADAFLTKFDASGNELWSQQIGTASFDRSYSVAFDASGNAYMSGETQGGLGGPNWSSSRSPNRRRWGCWLWARWRWLREGVGSGLGETHSRIGSKS